jgi:hypothetical protein
MHRAASPAVGSAVALEPGRCGTEGLVRDLAQQRARGAMRGLMADDAHPSVGVVGIEQRRSRGIGGAGELPRDRVVGPAGRQREPATRLLLRSDLTTFLR